MSNVKKALLLLLVIVVFLSILLYFKFQETRVQNKLVGVWNIEFENSYVVRDTLSQFMGMIILINSDKTIELPNAKGENDTGFFDNLAWDSISDDEENVTPYKKYLDEIEQRNRGSWEVINTNPDSIFINVPQNPLFGRYAVGFTSNKSVEEIILTNANTHIVCYRGGWSW